MKRLLFCALFALAIVACNHQAAETRNALETTQWYVYNNPINDYDISIFAWMYNTIYYSACEITVFLRKGDMYYSIKQRTSYNSFIDVVAILSESTNLQTYWRVLKNRLAKE